MVGPEDLGDVIINDNVIALYASIALTEVEGVVTLSGKSSFSDYVGAKSKDAEKGITVTIDKATNMCTVNVEVYLYYGYNVYDVARKIQRHVKNAIESFTGITVERVNVTIKDVIVAEQVPPTGKAKNN
ncbi:MAG: Asp23/Gls24 family envelope stress response protein [Candidatus Hydrogenedentota bacterium]|uniref:Alkaline shock protein n=1 Tax=Sumerlaea chitinivorans TaxID=2250252 RepID=A0A2Z4Y4X3_SUMC1|nr:Alkaline shock protein [Candidatus Sumerlaea chitinivorans]MCX7964752.1 Asp23/Gls24 family envelope stress response protein [Candidatus Sumerlaea chitinivorans]RMH29667.1 MAG: Asp23/Gls24 family envelope stress response protein [Candidatus Hydrogenedentota bacterium]GIX44016.1 MAG: hypothetical protein KatS3mg130_0424 [Candidatus Sumerlaea sp.]